MNCATDSGLKNNSSGGVKITETTHRSNGNFKAVIVDYGVGNIRSVENALRAVATQSGFDVSVSKDPKALQEASCLILPGVGAFGDSMRALEACELIPTLEEEVLNKKKPLLGICVGYQLLFESSEEGEEKGFGWLPGKVVHFDPSIDMSVPHFGWNDIQVKNNDWLFDDIDGEKNFYFAHSYHAQTEGDHVVATCDYGYEFPVFVRKDNIFGMQFHPEKSRNGGLSVLRNFLSSAEKSPTQKEMQ